MESNYLFTSERIGFRTWQDSDLQELCRLNADPEVMRFFERPLTTSESTMFLKRMQTAMHKWGFCYFAVERKSDARFMGMIGLYLKEFEADFTPAVDVGIRLHTDFWNQNYGTEGMQRCIAYAFNDLNLEKLIAICSKANLASARALQKSGFLLQGEFIHPQMKPESGLQPCQWFVIKR